MKEKAKGRILVLVIGVLFLFSSEAFAVTKIKFVHGSPPLAIHVGAEALKKYVEEKSKGETQVSIFPLPHLGSEKEKMEGLIMGNYELGAITTAVVSTFIPEMAVFDLPWLFPDKKTAYAVLDDPKITGRVTNLLLGKGLVFLSWGENGFRDFSNSKRPIKKPADMRGLKFRVIPSEIYVDAYKQLGVDAVPLPGAELYTALIQGVVDGQDNSFPTILMAKLHEGQKYISRSNWTYSAFAVFANKAWFDKLPKAHQEIIREASKDLEVINRAHNDKMELEAYKVFKDAGKEINELTSEEKMEFRKLMGPLYEKWRKKVGESWGKEVFETIERVQAKK